MSISTTVRKVAFVGDGDTGPFAFAFKVFADTDLYIVKRTIADGTEVDLALTTDYTVSVNADQDNHPGGSVTLTASLSSDYSITITSSVDNLQGMILSNQGGFYPAVINTAMDRATIQIQQLQDQVDRSIKYPLSQTIDPAGVTGASPTLPVPDAGKYLAWNSTALALENKDPILTDTGATNIRYLSNYASLTAAVAAAGAVPTTLVLDVDGTVTANLTVPATLQLIGSEMSNIAITSGMTLTINGSFTGGLHQAFSGSGSVAGLSEARPEWFGAAGSGAVDDAAAIQKAFDSGAPVVIFASGRIYNIGSTVTSALANRVQIDGTLRPTGNAVLTGTPLLKITSSNVLVTGSGTVDGRSATFNVWAGIAVNSSPTARISNVRVEGLRFVNLGIDNMTTSGVAALLFDCVDNGRIADNHFSNCGMVSVFKDPAFPAADVVGGYGIYMSFCARVQVVDNTFDTVGAVGIMNAAGVDALISGNRLYKITRFALKSGYSSSMATTVTGGGATSASTFYVAKDANTNLRWVRGAGFSVMNAAGLAPTGVVKTIVDGGSYWTITTAAPMYAAPEIGVLVQLLECGTVYSGNSVDLTGDNGFDLNGWGHLVITGNSLSRCGMYRDLGAFTGTQCGIWLGYDKQESYDSFICKGLLIAGNTVASSANSAISVMVATFDLHVEGNLLTDYNLSGDPSSENPENGGIELTRISFKRSEGYTVVGNTCFSPYGYGIRAAFAADVFISGNKIKSKQGILLDQLATATVSNNHVEVLSTAAYGAATPAYGIKLQDTGGGSNSTISIHGNTLIGQSEGIGIHNTDINYIPWDVFRNNSVPGSGENGGSFEIAVRRSGDEGTKYQSLDGAVYVDRIREVLANGAATTTFQINVHETGNMFLLAVNSEANLTTALQGLYLISRATTTPYFRTIYDCADVTLTFNVSNQVVITNGSGGQRTISAALTVLL